MTVKKICRNCKKEFETDNHRVEYCSKDCKETATKLRRKLRHYKKKKNKEMSEPVQCINPDCGKFYVRTIGNQIYCSKECANHIKKKEYQSYRSKNNLAKKKVSKYSINDIALIEKYYRVVHKVVKHYGVISNEVDNGKEYNLDEIRAAIRAQETKC